jgi:hypothetical protein
VKPPFGHISDVQSKPTAPGARQVLDEMAEAGAAGAPIRRRPPCRA